MADFTAPITPAGPLPLARPVTLWMSGYPCSGKTWLGDYLETVLNMIHIDGDERQSSKDPELMTMTTNLLTAFYDYWLKNKEAPERLWRPYYALVCDDILRSRAENPSRDIVCSFSIFTRYIRDYVRSRVPEITFVLLHVETDILSERLVQRLARSAACAGRDPATHLRASIHLESTPSPDLAAALAAEPFDWRHAYRLYTAPWLVGLQPRGHPAVRPSVEGRDSAADPDSEAAGLAALPLVFDDEPATFTIDAGDTSRGGDLCGVARALHALCGLGPVVAMQTETDAGGNRVLVAPLVPACGADADEATRVAACRAMCEAVSRRNYARWEEKAAKGERWG